MSKNNHWMNSSKNVFFAELSACLYNVELKVSWKLDMLLAHVELYLEIIKWGLALTAKQAIEASHHKFNPSCED